MKILKTVALMTQNGVQIPFNKDTGDCAVYVNNWFIPIIEYGDTFTPAQQSPNLHQAVFTSTVHPQAYQSSPTAEALNQPTICKEHEKVDMHIYQQKNSKL